MQFKYCCFSFFAKDSYNGMLMKKPAALITAI